MGLQPYPCRGGGRRNWGSTITGVAIARRGIKGARVGLNVAMCKEGSPTATGSGPGTRAAQGTQREADRGAGAGNRTGAAGRTRG